MKKNLSLPLAWCVELNRRVTPEDMLKRRTDHVHEKLTFLCPECQRPLTFQPRIKGISAQGYFSRRKGQYHQVCIAKINYENPERKNVLAFHNFEDFFESAEMSHKESTYFLLQCRHAVKALQKEVASKGGSKEVRLFKILAHHLTQIEKPCEALEIFFRETEKTYTTLRLKIKGY